MKFLVDELPFYGNACMFSEVCQWCCDSEVCPRYWDKYDVEDREHECPWLKEQEVKQE